MISITNDIATRFNALYHSNEISGYIYARLPEGTLQTGWIEQGLLAKGMKGQLRDKTNQESLVIPADRFARLIREMSSSGSINIALIGSKGLTERKFSAIIFNESNAQYLVALQANEQSPQEIFRIIIQHVLATGVTKEFEEPNLDYVEQLKMDASDGLLKDMLVVSLPKERKLMSDWIKTAFQKDSPDVKFRHGTSRDISVFSALLTRWVSSLELFRATKSAIAALVFVKEDVVDFTLWDSPMRIAVFARLVDASLEEVSRKYLLPLWTAPEDEVKPTLQRKEVVLESRTGFETKHTPPDKKMVQIDELRRNIESLARRINQLSISKLEKRLEALETQVQTKSDSSGHEKGSFDALQSRLSENIDRIDLISKRLIELEKRIRKIDSSG
ncbi:MAG: hypothetical protein ACFFCP_09195 [Promethearchaeota archaeon]